MVPRGSRNDTIGVTVARLKMGMNKERGQRAVEDGLIARLSPVLCLRFGIISQQYIALLPGLPNPLCPSFAQPAPLPVPPARRGHQHVGDVPPLLRLLRPQRSLHPVCVPLCTWQPAFWTAMEMGGCGKDVAKESCENDWFANSVW